MKEKYIKPEIESIPFSVDLAQAQEICNPYTPLTYADAPYSYSHCTCSGSVAQAAS